MVGTDVILYEKTKTGVDALNNPIYTETPVTVHNVIAGAPTTADLATSYSTFGKIATYELCIPKGDTHTWEDSRVDLFGYSFRTFGFVREYIEANVPLAWNKKVMVERYG